MTTYINQKENGEVETIDEFDTRKEAREMLGEYQMAFHGGDIYLSNRCTNDWRDTSACIDSMEGGDASWQELMLS